MRESIQVVIMAGGAGTRFWPYSTPQKPKQFLDLTGEGTMIQLTVRRLKGFVPVENIWVITSSAFAQLVCQQCPELLPEQVVGEPMARDTAAAVALGAGLVVAKDPEAVMVILPADHMIRDTTGFQQSIMEAVELAKEDRFVTLGIEPHYPAEIYGYLQVGQELRHGYHLRRFVEKPIRELAEGYLAAGGYYWNAGMFIWKAQLLLSALDIYLPDHASMARQLGQSWGQAQWLKLAEQFFSPLKKVSIDFGLMEKLSDIAMIPAGFDWSDVGGWPALEEFLSKDEHGNAILGAHVVRDSSNNIIITQNSARPTLVAGISDSIIINGDAGLLVCHRDEIERVKDLIQQVLALPKA